MDDATATLAAPAAAGTAPVTPADAESRAAHAAALAALGARPELLDARQRQELARDGFLLLPGHFTGDILTRLRAAHDRLMDRKYPTAAPSPADGTSDFWYHEAGTRRLNDLVSADPVFDALYTDPVVLAAVEQLIGRPIKLDSINAREASPGHGEQNWHRDHALIPDQSGMPSVNTAWFLDDITPENGPTRVIPASHTWPSGPEAMTDAIAARALQVLGPAGTVLVFATPLWHSGTRNTSPRPRRLVHTSFVHREADLGEREQRLLIRKSTWERISPAARWILAV